MASTCATALLPLVLGLVICSMCAGEGSVDEELRDLFDMKKEAAAAGDGGPEAAGDRGPETAGEENPEAGPLAEVSMRLVRTGSNGEREGEAFEAYARMWEGEDAAVAAFRFGELHQLRSPDTLVELSSQLDDVLQGKGHTEEVMEGIKELCQCNGKTCSAGKLLKRADEHRKTGLYDAMGADLIRALRKKGLEETVRDTITTKLGHAYEGLVGQRKREAKEAEDQRKAEERAAEEAVAVEESRKRKARDEEDWVAFSKALGQAAEDDSEEKAAVSLKLVVTSSASGQEEKSEVRLHLQDDDHPEEAAFHFCLRHGLGSSDIHNVADMLRKHADEHDHTCKPKSTAEDALAAEAVAEKESRKGEFTKAGAILSRALSAQSLDEESKERMRGGMRTAMRHAGKVRAFEGLVALGKWKEALSEVDDLPRLQGSTTTYLLEARCHQQLGQVQDAFRAAARAVERGASHGSWKRGQARMMAVTLGANAAMEAGSNEKALKFYQTVLKFDPDCEEVRKQYRGLKKLTKLLDKAEEQVNKGKNFLAMETIDECLSQLRGLDVDSPLFRSVIQLKLCRVQSGMGKHEEALTSCDAVVQQRSIKVPGLFVDPRLLGEAYLARAKALMHDDDFDGAVSDCRQAMQKLGDAGSMVDEVREVMREAERKSEEWKGSDRRPPQRDHSKILGLPVNLDQSGPDVRCHWLKKQYKVTARKWHPDKYKGNKKRAERKMRDAQDAKDELTKRWGCKGGR